MIIFTVMSSTVAGKVGGPWGDKPRQATGGSLGFTKARKIQQEAMKADNLTIFSENVDTGWQRFSTHCTTWKKRRQKFEIFQSGHSIANFNVSQMVASQGKRWEVEDGSGAFEVLCLQMFATWSVTIHRCAELHRPSNRRDQLLSLMVDYGRQHFLSTPGCFEDREDH